MVLNESRQESSFGFLQSAKIRKIGQPQPVEKNACLISVN